MVFNSLETGWCGLRRWCDSSGAGGSHGHPVFGLGPRHWRAVSSIGEDSSIYHLDFLFLYPIEVRPMDRGRTRHRLWLGFRLRLGVETPEGDEAGRFAADEAFFAL